MGLFNPIEILKPILDLWPCPVLGPEGLTRISHENQQGGRASSRPISGLILFSAVPDNAASALLREVRSMFRRRCLEEGHFYDLYAARHG